MVGYGWEEYDVRHGGRQIIHDAENKIDITTEFVKFPGGEHGGSWGVRIKGTPRKDAPERLMTTVLFYGQMDGLGTIRAAHEPNPLGYKGTVTLAGQTMELGEFKIDITEGPGTNMHPPAAHATYGVKPLDRTLVASLQVPAEALWQTTRRYSLSSLSYSSETQLTALCD
jgi:mannosyl-oligosaccharide glucosidase